MGYEEHRAKKTCYRGEWYDSNLEARTAESLDALGIAYEHQRQCFRDGRFPYRQYTPDFHLPNSDCYIEVCGVFDERHQGNVRVLAEILGAAEDRLRVMVVGGRQGATMGYFVRGGQLVGRPVTWTAPDGCESCDLFWLADNHKG